MTTIEAPVSEHSPEAEVPDPEVAAPGNTPLWPEELKSRVWAIPHFRRQVAGYLSLPEKKQLLRLSSRSLEDFVGVVYERIHLGTYDWLMKAHIASRRLLLYLEAVRHVNITNVTAPLAHSSLPDLFPNIEVVTGPTYTYRFVKQPKQGKATVVFAHHIKSTWDRCLTTRIGTLPIQPPKRWAVDEQYAVSLVGESDDASTSWRDDWRDWSQKPIMHEGHEDEENGPDIPSLFARYIFMLDIRCSASVHYLGAFLRRREKLGFPRVPEIRLKLPSAEHSTMMSFIQTYSRSIEHLELEPVPSSFFPKFTDTIMLGQALNCIADHDFDLLRSVDISVRPSQIRRATQVPSGADIVEPWYAARFGYVSRGRHPLLATFRIALCPDTTEGEDLNLLLRHLPPLSQLAEFLVCIGGLGCKYTLNLTPGGEERKKMRGVSQEKVQIVDMMLNGGLQRELARLDEGFQGPPGWSRLPEASVAESESLAGEI